MNDFELHTEFPRAVSELKNASGISRGQNVNSRFLYLLQFPVQDLHRKLVLRNVVDPRATAALIRAFNLYKLYAWDGFQQLSGLAFYTLAVNQVARIVVADTLIQRIS